MNFFSRYFTKEPHVAGSPRNNELARHIARKWRSYGFDEVEIAKYDMLLSVPSENQRSKVEILDDSGDVKFRTQAMEKVWTWI